MIENMGKVSILGLMEDNIKDGGAKGNNMDQDNILQKKKGKLSTAYGKMGKGLNGKFKNFMFQV